MTDAHPKRQPLCGDATCESYACTQEARDAYAQRQWDTAGQFVADVLGITYPFTKQEDK